MCVCLGRRGWGQVEGLAQGWVSFSSTLSLGCATREDPSRDSGPGIESRDGSEQNLFYLCLPSITFSCGYLSEELITDCSMPISITY